MNRIKTILITGGNGYLGSRLTYLLCQDYNLIVVNRSYDCDRLASISNKVKIYNSNKDKIEEIFNNNIDIIIHTATLYDRNNKYSANQLCESNLDFPRKLLLEGIKNKVSYFINIDTPLNMYTNLYSLTKKQFLNWLLFYKNEINIVNLQLQHFYGPGASDDNFITSMVSRMINSDVEIDLTHGEQKRDFIYIDDLLDLFEYFISNINKFSGFNEFEVGSGYNYLIREIVEKIKKITLAKTRLNFGAIPYRKNELMNSKVNLEKLKQIKWNTKVSMEEGLKNVIKFEKSKKD